jgi:hypothetical protein
MTIKGACEMKKRLVMSWLALVVGMLVFGQSAFADGLALPVFAKSTQGADSGSFSPEGGGSAENGILSTQYLETWMVTINNPNDSIIEFRGRTDTYSNVDTVGVLLYLQAKNNVTGVWTDVLYLGEWKSINDDEVLGLGQVTAPGGYYYRIRGVHYANEGNTTEQVGSVTGSIYID